MTIRVYVNPLDRAGKKLLVKARLNRDRSKTEANIAKLTIAEIGQLREARPHVEVPEAIINTVLDIYQELYDDTTADFKWAWTDYRRFGRVFDVMQAHVLLNGRTTVGKQDLIVLEWLLWDSEEDVPVLKAKLAPYTRTPLIEAQEAVDALLSPSGIVETVRKGDRSKGVQALQQCESALEELKRQKSQTTDGTMESAIETLITQVGVVKDDVIAVVTGTKKTGGA